MIASTARASTSTPVSAGGARRMPARGRRRHPQRRVALLGDADQRDRPPEQRKVGDDQPGPRPARTAARTPRCSQQLRRGRGACAAGLLVVAADDDDGAARHEAVARPAPPAPRTARPASPCRRSRRGPRPHRRRSRRRTAGASSRPRCRASPAPRPGAPSARSPAARVRARPGVDQRVAGDDFARHGGVGGGVGRLQPGVQPVPFGCSRCSAGSWWLTVRKRIACCQVLRRAVARRWPRPARVRPRPPGFHWRAQE